MGHSGSTDRQDTSNTKEIENRQIRVLTAEGGTILFELNDSSASGDLYAQLPLTVQIEDFSTNEKIFLSGGARYFGHTAGWNGSRDSGVLCALG